MVTSLEGVRISVALLLVAALSAPACGGSPSPPPERPSTASRLATLRSELSSLRSVELASFEGRVARCAPPERKTVLAAAVDRVRREADLLVVEAEALDKRRYDPGVGARELGEATDELRERARRVRTRAALLGETLRSCG